jgi:hypothetical protein
MNLTPGRIFAAALTAAGLVSLALQASGIWLPVHGAPAAIAASGALLAMAGGLTYLCWGSRPGRSS